MNADNFAYWLQGFFELTRSNSLTENQVQEIKNHLKLVFDKKTPDVYGFTQPSEAGTVIHIEDHGSC